MLLLTKLSPIHECLSTFKPKLLFILLVNPHWNHRFTIQCLWYIRFVFLYPYLYPVQVKSLILVIFPMSRWTQPSGSGNNVLFHGAVAARVPARNWSCASPGCGVGIVVPHVVDSIHRSLHGTLLHLPRSVCIPCTTDKERWYVCGARSFTSHEQQSAVEIQAMMIHTVSAIMTNPSMRPHYLYGTHGWNGR